MTKMKRSPGSGLAVIGLFMMFALVSSVGACSYDASETFNRILNIVKTGERPLPDETQRKFNQLSVIYRQKSSASDDEDQLAYIRYAFMRVRSLYVRSVPDAELIDAAIKGVQDAEVTALGLRPTSEGKPARLVEAALDAMLVSLDPHSSYMNPEEFRESFVQTKGEFGGLGIEVTMDEGFVKVVAPIEDTPAARAGMLSGDLITHVDGEPVLGKSLSEAVRTMRGAPGTTINLIVRRKGRADFPVAIVRAIIKVRSVRWHPEGNIGYIRVSKFTEQVEFGVETAIEDLRATMGSNLKGYILDLRNNPGGLLNQSIYLSDAFLEEGEIVSVRGRRPAGDQTYVASSGDLAEGLPMVVLINGGSASASEIVASALKYHGRATVMGSRSFGKGSVQTIFPLPVEGALKLTMALYYSPAGHTIQAQGVAPNIIIKPTNKIDFKVEADIPGAIPAPAEVLLKQNQPVIAEEACPEVGKRGDRVLGCAIAFLQAGTQAKFLASYGSNSQM